MFSNKAERKGNEEMTNSNNIIGKGTTLQGDIETFGNLRVEGKIIGNIKTKSKVALGQSSDIHGNIVAQNAEIEGSISGKIEVSELLVLKSTANVHGDIITNKLIVESGSTIDGKCEVGVNNKEVKFDSKEKKERVILKAQS